MLSMLTPQQTNPNNTKVIGNDGQVRQSSALRSNRDGWVNTPQTTVTQQQKPLQYNVTDNNGQRRPSYALKNSYSAMNPAQVQNYKQELSQRQANNRAQQQGYAGDLFG